MGVDACPDEADLAEFVRGEMAGEAALRVEAHLDGCEPCAQVVTDLVRIFDDDFAASDQGIPTQEGARTEPSIDGDEPNPQVEALASGAEVGRYRVLECIGFGGMGVVYSAYDPQLDRRVALKVLRGGSGGAEETRRNVRLLREAKVMAKLSHANVIVVHDVGSYEGRVFLAMEFVEGTTLGRWMRAAPRSWRELRDTFLAAGSGLAAAHHAGLVHRDFKPDNVLIGDDGRVRVTDFGLARSRDESIEQSLHGAVESAAPGQVASGDTLATLTKTGVLVGTPAYMAPEEYAGQTVSGATDQFAFCVAFYEALYGERPFAGRTLAELASNVCSGTRRPLGEAKVPPRVRDAILRGLSVEPDQRFASMEELLAVINRRPTRMLRRWAMVGVPTVVAAGSLWWNAQPADAGPILCRAEGSMDGVWNREARGRLEGGLAGQEGSQAAIDAVEAYAEQWTAARDLLCDAPDGDAVALTREHCLTRARARLDALLDVFASKDELSAEGTLRSLQALPEPEPCTSDSLAAANLVPLPPLHLEEDVAQGRTELDRIRALITAGTVEEVVEALDAAMAGYEGIDDGPFQAELRYVQGRVWMLAGRYGEAKLAFEEAAMLGVSSHHRAVAAEAWARLVFLETDVFDDLEAAHRAARMARAELDALGNPRASTNTLRAHEAGLAVREQRYDEALHIYEQLLALPENDAPMRRADLLLNVAGVYAEQGRWDEAEAAADEYLEFYRTTFGPDNANLVLGRFNLGVIAWAADRPEDALEQFRLSLRLAREVLPERHPSIGDAQMAICDVLFELERYEEAVPTCRRARTTLLDGGQLPASRKIAVTLSLAQATIRAGESSEGEVLLDEVRDLLKSLPARDPELDADLLMARGDLARATDNLALAQAQVERAVGLYAGLEREDEFDLAAARLELAEIVEARGDPQYARELYDDVLATQDPDAEILRERASARRQALPTE